MTVRRLGYARFWLSSCRQLIHPGCPVSVVRCASGQRRMWAPGIIVADPPSQSGTQFRSGLECVQIDALILQAAPEPLDEYVVHPAPTAVHRDAYTRFLQHTGAAR